MAKAAKKRAFKGTESKAEEGREAKGMKVPYPGAKGKNPFAGAASAAMKQKRK